jgi:hypothetical protein
MGEETAAKKVVANNCARVPDSLKIAIEKNSLILAALWRKNASSNKKLCQKSDCKQSDSHKSDCDFNAILRDFLQFTRFYAFLLVFPRFM